MIFCNVLGIDAVFGGPQNDENIFVVYRHRVEGHRAVLLGFICAQVVDNAFL